jgi:hypothetical protein
MAAMLAPGCGQRRQVDVEVRLVDLVEITTAEGIDAKLELRAQRLELEPVLASKHCPQDTSK